VTVGPDGRTLTITGEAGATADVYDAAGLPIGSVVLDGSGNGSIVVPESNGGDASVTLTDAAGNISLETPVVLPDTLAPMPPVVVLGEDGVTLAIEGEAGATATVSDADGNVLGTVVLDEDGLGSVKVPASDGGNAEVTLADDAGNVSDATAVLLPDTQPDNLPTVFDTARLSHTITEDPEATPSTDTKTESSLLDLGLLGSLLDLDIGTGHPTVHFDVDTATNSVVFAPKIGGVLDVNLLSNFVFIIETKDEFGRWVRYEDDHLEVQDGLLDLLGLLGESGTIELTDFAAGEYRAALVPNPALLSVTLIEERTLSVTATDVVESHEVMVEAPAEGNVFASAEEGATDGLVLTSVVFNGTEHEVTEAGITVDGAYGSLVLDAAGNYTYTPDPDLGVGVDAFDLKLENPVTGALVEGRLEVGSQFGEGEPLDAITAVETVDTTELNAKPSWTQEEHNIEETVALDLLGWTSFFYPSINIEVGEGESVLVSFDAAFFSAVGVASTGRVTLNKLVDGESIPVTNIADGGLLDLLGTAQTNVSGTVELTEPGTYQLHMTPSSVLAVGTTAKIDAVITTFDLSTIGDYDIVTADGNVLAENELVDDTTLVTSVNGEAVNTVSGSDIVGTHGTLTIDVYGNYTYTPNKAADGIGQVDSFTYTVRNAAGATDEATLHIRIDSSEMGLIWSADPSAPAGSSMDAVDDIEVAILDSANVVTLGGPTVSGATEIATSGSGTTTATVSREFTIDPEHTASVRFQANSTNTGSSSVTITVTGDNGFSQVLTGASTTVDQVLNDLPAGNYTVTADYTRTAGWWIKETLNLGVTTQSLTHLDEFVAIHPEPVVGNVLDDDAVVSPYTKFLMDDGTGNFAEVTEATTIWGDFGQLTINADGSYRYFAHRDLDAIGEADVFTYRLEHPNGTVSEANLAFQVEHGEGPYVPPAPAMMAMFMAEDVVPMGEFGDPEGGQMPEGTLSYGEGDLIDFGGDDDLDLSFASDDSEAGTQEQSSGGGSDTAAEQPIEDPFAFLDDQDDQIAGSNLII
jgi:VCBS repeat-containing protein